MQLPKPVQGFFYVKRLCPSCFEEIYIGACDIVYQDGTVEHAPTDKRELALACITPKRLTPGTGYKIANRRCHECNYLMPYNVELVYNFHLPIIGDNLSGKSHYFGGFIEQLYNGSHYTAKCLTPQLEKQYREVYQTNSEMPRTAAAGLHVEPLVYELTNPPNRKSFNLLLYDTGGENFIEDARVVDVGRFIFHADALIFIADPVIIHPFFEAMDPTVQAQLDTQYGGVRRQWMVPAGRLSSINSFLRAQSRDSFSRPLAVMLSKSDLVRGILKRQPSPTMSDIRWLQELKNLDTALHDLQYIYDVTMPNVNKVDKHVRHLIDKVDQGGLRNATAGFKNVKFFATSATGEMATNRKYTSPQPSRCLDPVFWILHERGY